LRHVRTGTAFARDAGEDASRSNGDLGKPAL
jgi:hypothetical protein